MEVRILGTAAGGGLPQWNCACGGCEHARASGTGRTQDSVAFSADGRSWYLLNASPDVRTQILGTPALRPGPGRRETPVRGVLLSSAELDHTLGLLTLREADELTVFSNAAALAALTEDFPIRPALERYTRLTWRVLEPEQPMILDGGVEVRTTAVSDKRPKYAAPDRPGPWAVAYRLTDPATNGVFVYAPCLPTVDDRFLDFAAGAGAVLLDGTFLHAGEMTSRAGSARAAQPRMGHVPISDSLPRLAERPGPRYLYTHLNNTNPAAAPDAAERADLAEAGAGIAEDGQVLSL